MIGMRPCLLAFRPVGNTLGLYVPKREDSQEDARVISVTREMVEAAKSQLDPPPCERTGLREGPGDAMLDLGFKLRTAIDNGVTLDAILQENADSGLTEALARRALRYIEGPDMYV